MEVWGHQPGCAQGHASLLRWLLQLCWGRPEEGALLVPLFLPVSGPALPLAWLSFQLEVLPYSAQLEVSPQQCLPTDYQVLGVLWLGLDAELQIQRSQFLGLPPSPPSVSSSAVSFLSEAEASLLGSTPGPLPRAEEKVQSSSRISILHQKTGHRVSQRGSGRTWGDLSAQLAAGLA